MSMYADGTGYIEDGTTKLSLGSTDVTVAIRALSDDPQTSTNTLLRMMCLSDNLGFSVMNDILSLCVDGSNNNFKSHLKNGASNDPLSYGVDSSLSWRAYMMAIDVSANNYTVQVEKTELVTNRSLSLSSFAVDEYSLGGRSGDSAQLYTGKIAEAAIWTKFLTKEERDIYTDGGSPILIQPNSLVSYFPLLNSRTYDSFDGYPNMSIAGGVSLDNNDNPNIIFAD